MYTDTHCHVLKEYYDEIHELIEALPANNIKRIIINGYNERTNLEVLELTNRYPHVYGALGLHPDELEEGVTPTIELIKKNVNNPKIVAIGEIGLDYYHNKENKEAQQVVFFEFLKLAQDVNKPVIIHNRDATNDALNCLKQVQVKGVIHCFSGSVEIAHEFIKLGFKLGINGIVTFKNSNLPETLKQVETEHLVLETDCPYITPEPFRKLPNEPKYLSEVAKKLSEIYGLTMSELVEILEANTKTVFDF